MNLHSLPQYDGPPPMLTSELFDMLADNLHRGDPVGILSQVRFDWTLQTVVGIWTYDFDRHVQFLINVDEFNNEDETERIKDQQVCRPPESWYLYDVHCFRP